jgi:diamine N-acetyltransferase
LLSKDTALTITYRTPHTEDALALSALGRQAFTESFGHLYKPEDLAAFLDEVHSVDMVRGEIAHPQRQYLVAEQDGAMVGYCKVTEDTTSDYDSGSKTMFELKQLYVLSAHHGSGVAQHLMDWVIEKAQAYNADEVILSVYSDNPRGQAFYKKYGFAHAADTIFMIGSQADHEFLYVKSLKN